jgi:hypothetical protein
MLPDDIVLAIWGHTWTHLDSTRLLRQQWPQMLCMRRWPFWDLFHRQAPALGLWGRAGMRCPPVRRAPAGMPHMLPLPFPQLPPPPRFTHVVRGCVVACIVEKALWLGRVGMILQNTTRGCGTWRRLHCGDFALVQLQDHVFWWRRRMRPVTSWCVL